MEVRRSEGNKFPPVSDQMKAWSAGLAAELRDWPKITQKPFFGFTALYRGRIMFGILPRTRSIFNSNAVAFRFHSVSRATKAMLEKDARIATFDKEKTRWFVFELSSDSDLHDALNYFGRAFDEARGPKKTR